MTTFQIILLINIIWLVLGSIGWKYFIDNVRELILTNDISNTKFHFRVFLMTGFFGLLFSIIVHIIAEKK